MNLALSDEQEFLRDAARDALSRFKTIEAAREGLEDRSALPDLWPSVVEAGWTGLLVSEEHGGAGLGPFDAMLVLEECGKVLAPTPLLGLLPATYLLDRGASQHVEAVAAGERRAVYLPARPPSDTEPRWTVEAPAGLTRAAAPLIAAPVLSAWNLRAAFRAAQPLLPLPFRRGRAQDGGGPHGDRP